MFRDTTVILLFLTGKIFPSGLLGPLDSAKLCQLTPLDLTCEASDWYRCELIQLCSKHTNRGRSERKIMQLSIFQKTQNHTLHVGRSCRQCLASLVRGFYFKHREKGGTQFWKQMGNAPGPLVPVDLSKIGSFVWWGMFCWIPEKRVFCLNFVLKRFYY